MAAIAWTLFCGIVYVLVAFDFKHSDPKEAIAHSGDFHYYHCAWPTIETHLAGSIFQGFSRKPDYCCVSMLQILLCYITA